MPAQVPLYQEIFQKIRAITRSAKIRKTSVVRLALLVTGIIAARSCILAQIAAELLTLDLTKASSEESIARRLRRTLNDARLSPETCYEPVLHQAIDWQYVLQGSRWVFLTIDESSKEDEIHLFRVSLSYWGGSLPLAWDIWKQNQKMPKGTYWLKVDGVLARVAALLPDWVKVMVTADRAFDTPPLVDRLNAHGWHWDIRCKAKGSVHYRDCRGREWELSKVIKQRVHTPGMRWKAQGWVFRDAGWRKASVIAIWAIGEKEPLVVITDLRPSWEIANWYGRRFWIETGFRNDKKKGWQWEESQVQELAHQKVLLLAMTWATLVMLCVGIEEAKVRCEAVAQRAAKREARGKAPAKPDHPRQSVFTIGLHTIRRWLYDTSSSVIQWLLPDVNNVSWNQSWYSRKANLYIFKTVRP